MTKCPKRVLIFRDALKHEARFRMRVLQHPEWYPEPYRSHVLRAISACVAHDKMFLRRELEHWTPRKCRLSHMATPRMASYPEQRTMRCLMTGGNPRGTQGATP